MGTGTGHDPKNYSCPVNAGPDQVPAAMSECICQPAVRMTPEQISILWLEQEVARLSDALDNLTLGRVPTANVSHETSEPKMSPLEIAEAYVGSDEPTHDDPLRSNQIVKVNYQDFLVMLGGLRQAKNVHVDMLVEGLRRIIKHEGVANPAKLAEQTLKSAGYPL